MFLRRFARRPSSLKMMSVKETSAIVGQKVDPEVGPNSREVLIGLYSKTLNIIARVPENEGYRKSMESLTRQRLAVCESEKDVENIEKQIGKVDEAKFEYKVLDKLLGMWKTKIHLDDIDPLSVLITGVHEARPCLSNLPLHHLYDLSNKLLSIIESLKWDPWGVNDDYVSEEMQNGIEIPKPAPVHSGPLPEDFFATLKAAANVKPTEDEDFFANGWQIPEDEDKDKDTNEKESTIPARS
ncbi:probable NADH dehydrogenase [ubiquinone] 1 alpha subcomplex subunit 5, mitochondrial [Tanacetum coccineum]